MTSQTPYQLYVQFLKIPRDRYAAPTQWDERNCACIHEILQHVSTWTFTSKRDPALSVVHELCKLKQIRISIKAGKLRMMQTLIPKLVMEMTKCNVTYQLPMPRTNISRTLLERPAALITTPIGVKGSVPAKKLLIGTETNSAPTPHAVPPVRQPRAADAVQVGVMTFDGVDEYKHFLRVGKHIVHSSPCVAVKDIKWGHCLTYEQWRPTRGFVDGSPTASSWECRCRRRRKPKFSKKKSTPSVKPAQRETKKDPAQGGVLM